MAELKVSFLASSVHDRDWNWTSSPRYDSAVLKTSRFTWGSSSDDALYVIRQRISHLVRWADVVVLGGWESPAYLQVFLEAKLNGRATVLFYESTLESNMFSMPHPIAVLRRFIIRRVDTVLTGGVASSQAVAAMGKHRSHIITGFNAVDVDEFSRAVRAIRSADPPSAEGHKFLFVGRLLALKNVPSLVQAFVCIADAEDELFIVGDGPERDEIRSLIGGLEPSLGQRIHMMGSLSGDDLFQSYARAGTLVLPSTREVWGMVVNEALAAGLHVVVSDRAGAAPSVSSMQGAYVCRPEAKHLAAAMSRSRAEWTGPIECPEILGYTPNSSAHDAVRSCRLALEVKNGRRRRAFRR